MIARAGNRGLTGLRITDVLLIVVIGGVICWLLARTERSAGR
ncbi:hypothetical protein ACFVDI_01590 [Nocardioides sp. NPDC057767]